ncbi:MAG: ABC transporter permease [Chloroflexi bacterium]|nr:ABC transporter permease [Chloroflexota bacterium]
MAVSPAVLSTTVGVARVRSAPGLRSNSRRALQRFLHHRLALAGAAAILLLVLVAFAAPLVARQSPTQPDMRAVRSGPSVSHWLGTDEVGRDVWSRLVYGARTSLSVGFGAVAIAVTIGTLLGALAGFYGSWSDQLTMRLTDTVMSVPPLLMIIVFVSLVGPSLQTVIIVIALMTWPGTARLVRGQFLTLREREFVLAARVLGARDGRIIVHHVLPNLLGPLSVVATFGVASAILLEAGLSFLGLGIKPPLSSWGVMINSAQSSNVLINLPWLWIPPATTISLTVLAVNFIGDGLRDALDPRR